MPNQGLIGASSSCIATLLVQPLEIIKMVMIIKADPKNTKLSKVKGAFEYIYTSEGVYGFYRGIRPALIRNMSAGFLYFQFLSMLSKQFRSYQLNYSDFMSSFLARGKLYIITRGISNLITNPILVVETRHEVPGNIQNSIKTSLTTIIREEGVLNLFRGGMTCAIKEGVFAGIYYVVYRQVTEKLRKGDTNFNPAITFTAGMVAGFIGTSISHPFEVLRARLQTNYYIGTHSIISSFKRIKRLEGFEGFFKGIGPRLVRKPLANSLTFLLVEQFNHIFYGLHFDN